MTVSQRAWLAFSLTAVAYVVGKLFIIPGGGLCMIVFVFVMVLWAGLGVSFISGGRDA